jgi:NAD(P)-dependent dehydrogenase (short-subunit alcohol dehydrogenase family)
VSVVGSKNPNWFDTHQIPKNAAYAIPDEAATRLMTASLDVTDPTAATRVVSDAVDHFGRIDVLVNNAGYGLPTAAVASIATTPQTVTLAAPIEIGAPPTNAAIPPITTRHTSVAPPQARRPIAGSRRHRRPPG